MGSQLPEELRAALDRAIKSGKYLITVSYKTNALVNDLQHYQITNDYPTKEIENTIREVAKLVLPKVQIEDLGRDIESQRREGWER